MVRKPATEEDFDKYPKFMEPLIPVAETLNALTSGWALSTADLSPETPTTPLGVLFLATNLSFLLVGGVLWTAGEVPLALAVEVSGVVSYWYHYNQLKGDQQAVKLSLFVDYMTAGSSLLLGTNYLLRELDVVHISTLADVASVLSATPEIGYAVASATLAIASLLLCWVWEYGLPYLFLHSVWHREYERRRKCFVFLFTS